MNKKLFALFGAASLTMAACGSGSESGGGIASEAATTTEAPATTEADATETAAETADDAPTEEAESDEAGADEAGSDGAGADEAPVSMAVREPMTLAAGTAGPITVSPTECTVEGAELEGPGGVESIAFAGDHLFVALDVGVLAFSFTGGADCSLTLDTAMGTNGVMTDDDSYDSLAGTADGRLVASSVIGSIVFDTVPGYSYECDMTGSVSLSPDGTTALMNFYGREAVEEWTLTDTNCSETGALTFAEIPEVKFLAYDGADFLVGGSNAAEDVVVSRYSGGAPVWTAGGGETGADDWWGWVHGMSVCGDFTCMIDTNTNALALIDASGTVAAAFDFSDLIGLRGWIEPMVVGPDGAAYVLHSDAVDDENDIRTYFGSIVRLDVTA